ncbi:receptor-like protein EIX2 [Bidens hawaiensis]|uniref:receptor-like protein EIX2 n=1 Tax=Bidens hawaiensis TaxID=980011 RepID=UPI004049FC3E
MGNQLGLGLYLFILSVFLCATTYTCLDAPNLTVSCHERERLALLEFKHNVKDYFKVLSSWVGIHCCSWKGVSCDGDTRSVVSLRLRGNYREFYEDDVEEDYYLVGEKVNTYLAELRHLKHLDLSGNNFQQSRIPEFIGSFKQLSYLNLSNAGFSDDMAWVSGLSSLELLDLGNVKISRAKNIDMVLYMIPSLQYLSLPLCGLSNGHLGIHHNSSKILPNIKHLDLSWNFFEGELPCFFQNLTSLTFLDLSSNNLSLAWNSLKFLNLIPSLSELHLSKCGLHNALLSPNYFNFSAHSYMHYIDLRDNLIGGRFLYEIINITSLKVLDLSRNNLNSSIPTMPNLLKLDVSENKFKHIELVGIWRQCNLKELSLSYNIFNGEMIGPSTNMSECSQYAFEMLDSSQNQLNGTIPEVLGRLTNLKALYLGANSFSGSIPEALERVRSLEVLDLSDNELTGPIPTFLGKLTKLSLFGNQLSGFIPESLGRLAGLTELDLSSNQLIGPIPNSLGRLSSLHLLDVSNNSLEGVVFEAHLVNLSKLKYLHTDLNHKLIFNISHEWIPPFQLRSVVLSSCKINDEFPQWLKTQRNLEELWLSNASLFGLLPSWLRTMPIFILDLSHNKLGGSLENLPSRNPIHWVEPGDAALFLLQDNLFNGSIPRSLCRRTYLELLDVSMNGLSGNIPDCVKNLQEMKVLILSSNGLSGVLPRSLGSISLAWLKLTNNNFNGELPRDLGNSSLLSVLDLDNNKFSGNIPQWTGKDLPNLKVLSLRKNNFTGGIPQSLCTCSNLHILDVAHNNLTGSIPRCLGKLSGMIEARQEDSRYNSMYDSMEVSQVLKGIELEYTKTLDLVFNMDLSSNELSGEIPREVTSLSLLVGLNLSHNHLSGSIPDTIGNMKALNSLDFSDNQFTGMIPSSIASLNFLSSLNLSQNNLSGQIPTGNQLQTLTDPSIYASNKELCGAPLPNNCSNHENPPTTSKNKYKESNKPKKVWFYFDIMCGFATGFWSIIGVLLFKKQWRHKLFVIAEVTMDKVFVAVAVRVSNFRMTNEDK